MSEGGMDGAGALKRLVEGNARYARGQALPHGVIHDREALTRGQSPFAVVVCCSDSRVAPVLAFDAQPGELFLIQVAGNVLTPEGLASIEYAVSALSTPLIFVLGHTGCGAVGATIRAAGGWTPPGHIRTLTERIAPAVSKTSGAEDHLAAAVVENVRQTVAQLREAGPIVGPAITAGATAVAGGIYPLETGKIALID